MCDQLIDIYQTTCPEYYKWDKFELYWDIPKVRIFNRYNIIYIYNRYNIFI